VHLPATGKLAPIGGIEAASVKAIATFAGLLRGKLEFKKLIVNAPKLVLKPDVAAQPQPNLYGLETIGIALALADSSPFPDLLIRDAELLAPDPQTSGRSFRVPEIRVSKAVRPLSGKRLRRHQDGPNSPFDLWIKGEAFQAAFSGQRNVSADAVIGRLMFATSSEDPIAEKLRKALVPWEKANDIALSGEFNSSSGRIALDDASIRFGNRSAKGSIAIAFSGERRVLEGTLAYDVLDLTEVISEAPDGRRQLLFSASAKGGEARGETQQTFDLDLRISAERVRARDFEGGPFAVALTSQGDRISADIAELGLFGGTVSGRLEHNPPVSQGITIKLRGSRIEAASLADALSLPLPLRGPAGFSASLEAPYGNSLSSALSGATGSFKILLPYGGAVDGEASRRLTTALDGHDFAWRLAAGNLPLSQASVDGTINGHDVAATVEAESGKMRLFGSLTVALPGYVLNGKLAIGHADDEEHEPAAEHDRTLQNTLATLMISGTAAAPDFALTNRANFSN
jgi:hypothetical protein